MLGNMGFEKLYFQIIDRASAMFSINVLKFLMRQILRYLRADLRILKQVESLVELNWNGSAESNESATQKRNF